jgi:hypothetical protein
VTHDPKVITELWAWVCTTPEDGDGIPAVLIGDVMMPLVGSDKARILSLEPYAKAVGKVRGYPVRLVRFTNMEVVRELKL